MIRPLRLARIAAEAEGLRLRRMTQRTVVRLALLLVAAFWLFCAVAIFHVGVWFLLRNDLGWESQTAGLAMAGFDLAIAVVLLIIVALSAPGRVEREAREVRNRALENASNSLRVSAALLPALRLVVRLMRRTTSKE